MLLVGTIPDLAVAKSDMKTSPSQNQTAKMIEKLTKVSSPSPIKSLQSRRKSPQL